MCCYHCDICVYVLVCLSFMFVGNTATFEDKPQEVVEDEVIVPEESIQVEASPEDTKDLDIDDRQADMEERLESPEPREVPSPPPPSPPPPQEKKSPEDLSHPVEDHFAPEPEEPEPEEPETEESEPTEDTREQVQDPNGYSEDLMKSSAEVVPAPSEDLEQSPSEDLPDPSEDLEKPPPEDFETYPVEEPAEPDKVENGEETDSGTLSEGGSTPRHDPDGVVSGFLPPPGKTSRQIVIACLVLSLTLPVHLIDYWKERLSSYAG